MKPPPTEKSYHIFYQMMAGLHPEERLQLGLTDFSIKDLNYLNMGDTRQDDAEDAERFENWRSSLAILGIPFMDVVRVLSAILLLGNVRFTPRVGDDAFDVEVIGKEELHSVAKLLGISPTMLCQGLTMRTHSVRGQAINSMTDSHQVIFIYQLVLKISSVTRLELFGLPTDLKNSYHLTMHSGRKA